MTDSIHTFTSLRPDDRKKQIIEVSREQIEEMYARFETGMCDVASCHALALALSDHFGRPVRIGWKNGKWQAIDGDKTLSLPKSLYSWLHRIEVGPPVEPLEIPLNTPKIDLPLHQRFAGENCQTLEAA